MEAFNAKTQQLEEIVFSVDQNHEIIGTFPDGHFLKFPAGMSKKDIIKLLEAHEEANANQEVITPEMEKAAAEQLAKTQSIVDDLNDN